MVGIALCDALCAFKHMIQEDVDLHSLTTKFLSSLTRNQQECFSLLLNVKDENKFIRLQKIHWIWFEQDWQLLIPILEIGIYDE